MSDAICGPINIGELVLCVSWGVESDSKLKREEIFSVARRNE